MIQVVGHKLDCVQVHCPQTGHRLLLGGGIAECEVERMSPYTSQHVVRGNPFEHCQPLRGLSAVGEPPRELDVVKQILRVSRVKLDRSLEGLFHLLGGS
jgi:hypothetical protein